MANAEADHVRDQVMVDSQLLVSHYPPVQPPAQVSVLDHHVNAVHLWVHPDPLHLQVPPFLH